MKILIDTNILINLEANKIIEESFSQFYRLAIENNCRVLYHPKAISADIQRDKDPERQKITSSKLKKYQILENYSSPPQEFISNLKSKKANDEIDSIQLYQLQRGFVDYFITQDKGIHSNAKKIGLTSKVLFVTEILKKLEEQFTIVIPTHPILCDQSVRDIEHLFKTSFFESLRIDYGNYFDTWLRKCVITDRRCYTLIVENELQALLIYNVENVEDHKIQNVYEKVLKICTLKVADTAFGIKLGELFLNKMLEYCINQKINYLYLTVYPKQGHLINLLENFGFYRESFTNNQGFSEIRMIKCLNKTLVKSKENSFKIHPFYYDNESISKFAIPIRPNYYSNLFKDGKLRQPTFFDSSPNSVNEIQGNTIVKAYISNAKIKSLKPGDILLFYSSQSSQSIEPVGILETIKIVKDFEELSIIVSKKTVFSQEDLLKMFNEKGELHVITFRLITYLSKKIRLSKIKQLQSFKNNIQTITRVSETDYLQLKNEGYFDERYIID